MDSHSRHNPYLPDSFAKRLRSLLTASQHQQLDRIAERDPGAKVIAWYDSPDNQGPIVQGSDGRTHAVSASRLVEVVGVKTPLAHAMRRRIEEQAAAATPSREPVTVPARP